MPYPPQRLTCPAPSSCPVIKPGDLPSTLPVVQFAESTIVYRVYNGTWGYDEPNPGFGNARFSPFDALEDGRRVPVLYAAETPSGALLETIFHNVYQSTARIIYEDDLRQQLLVHVRTPFPLSLVDLRNHVLRDAGIARDQLVSSPSEHYACTRLVAQRLHQMYVDQGVAQGLVWHSRQAELSGTDPTVAMVVYTDSYGAGRGGWERIGPGSQNLLEGEGRLFVDAIATGLGATIVAQ